jgi:hypothetical protein
MGCVRSHVHTSQLLFYATLTDNKKTRLQHDRPGQEAMDEAMRRGMGISTGGMSAKDEDCNMQNELDEYTA